jgi:hypothetical protein
MLQPNLDDDVVATSETYSVGKFCELAFARVGLDYRECVTPDERFCRLPQVDLLNWMQREHGLPCAGLRTTTFGDGSRRWWMLTFEALMSCGQIKP